MTYTEDIYNEDGKKVGSNKYRNMPDVSDTFHQKLRAKGNIFKTYETLNPVITERISIKII